MKRKEGYILRNIAGSPILVPIGQEIANFNGIISLNDTAKFLWEQLEEDITTEQLIDRLTTEYEVDKEVATKDVTSFIETLTEKGMLE